MIEIIPADTEHRSWAQRQVTVYHYLHAPVDPRCSPFAYIAMLRGERVGCLIFGRPESTRCYDPQSRLTYGSFEDVQAGRCLYDRWEIINLARVWLDPRVQRGGSEYVPHAASPLIKAALARIGYDYLVAHPPVDCSRPYALRMCISYCDMRIHSGYLYRACRFKLARTNNQGIQTFVKPLPELTPAQDAEIQQRAERSQRSQRIRARRAQLVMDLGEPKLLLEEIVAAE